MKYKNKFTSIFLMAISLVLMVLPYGVAMRFMVGPGEEGPIHYYSYFDMTPIGYANWLPMLIAILSIAIIILLIASLKKLNLRKYIMNSLIACIFLSILSWVIFRSFTTVSLTIVLIYLLVCSLELLDNKKMI